MSAYIKLLQQSAPADSPHKLPLTQQFLEWYGDLPEIARDRPFSMVEFEQALGTQGKYISPVLLALGWQRKRRWSSLGQYHRYWVPPHILKATHAALIV
ncbi:hypothetical protein CNE_1c33180 [Cupriavidus necator N-1]|uniref:Uncharacterized protein n=1 Tax=Cupriavidus necator (strain ATCC 43291 / DSM 13513 / CCUG 52238 / LMG 8453 / N-1) TaxID=1042878 RepID=G0EY10_CUPNN|nr:hypothetical protein [Cupriavidus necator]AEI78623.1 hypothetical protein CNE_1c33180 [Cupriavidus necator N-1]MDX6012853.1 hypothetical protein [Cupriavidus necator]